MTHNLLEFVKNYSLFDLILTFFLAFCAISAFFHFLNTFNDEYMHIVKNGCLFGSDPNILILTTTKTFNMTSYNTTGVENCLKKFVGNQTIKYEYPPVITTSLFSISSLLNIRLEFSFIILQILFFCFLLPLSLVFLSNELFGSKTVGLLAYFFLLFFTEIIGFFFTQGILAQVVVIIFLAFMLGFYIRLKKTKKNIWIIPMVLLILISALTHAKSSLLSIGIFFILMILDRKESVGRYAFLFVLISSILTFILPYSFNLLPGIFKGYSFPVEQQSNYLFVFTRVLISDFISGVIFMVFGIYGLYISIRNKKDFIPIVIILLSILGFFIIKNFRVLQVAAIFFGLYFGYGLLIIARRTYEWIGRIWSA